MNEKYKEFKDQRLLIGVCGSTGVLSMPPYLSQFRALFKCVNLIVTHSAAQMIPVSTFKNLADEVYSDEANCNKNHIQIAREHDIMIIFPATANMLAIAAHGMASSLLSTVLLAFEQPIAFFPNMNLQMWENRMVKLNVKKLQDNGYLVYEPQKRLAYEIASKAYRENIVLPQLEPLLDFILSLTKKT